ncbi:hypothetical protein PR048_027065 [Dryococelus australis]|uniref:Uncharacterized protein n=1 Tax=Dryococelus australis TaxID=614101 RepID=A0ABQ9GGJ3_9NEOP|nr:hypothetical protein PR048_027065 [Dryococelus australis]
MDVGSQLWHDLPQENIRHLYASMPDQWMDGWMDVVMDECGSCVSNDRDTVSGEHVCARGVPIQLGTAGAAVAERLACSPPTNANLVQFPDGSLPHFRMWESCWIMPLVGGFSRRSPVFPNLSFRRCSILTSIILIGSPLTYKAVITRYLAVLDSCTIFYKPWCTSRYTSRHGRVILHDSSLCTSIWHSLCVRSVWFVLREVIQGEAGSVHSGVSPAFFQVGILLDNAAGRRVFSGFSRLPRPFIPALRLTHLASPSSAPKTSIVEGSKLVLGRERHAQLERVSWWDCEARGKMASCAFKAKKRGSDTGDSCTHFQSLIAPTLKACSGAVETILMKPNMKPPLRLITGPISTVLRDAEAGLYMDYGGRYVIILLALESLPSLASRRGQTSFSSGRDLAMARSCNHCRHGLPQLSIT